MAMLKGDPSFYDAVYSVVRRVPSGRVTTYGRVAVLLGAPRAARAVGYALANLSAGTDVPWQRVINAQGRISLRGDLSRPDLQRHLLESEGVVFGPDDRVDLLTFGWGGPETAIDWEPPRRLDEL